MPAFTMELQKKNISISQQQYALHKL